MQKRDFFREALTDFTQEAANGGAIRHLADLGYTVRQIEEALDFPASHERVQRAVWEQLVRRSVILQEEPGAGQRPDAARKKRTYVREYGAYGKVSFRLEEDEEPPSPLIHWKERRLEELAAARGNPRDILLEKVRENGECSSYMSCDFGLEAVQNPRCYQEMLDALHERQREYLSGLPWERRRVYHRLDSRMLEILLRLCEKELYQGECFFGKTEEKIKI